MKITFIATDRDAAGDDGWQETHETDAAGTPEEIIRRVIDNFNATLQPHERPRRLVRIVSAEGTAPKRFVMQHKWEKQNLFTISDKHGLYDRMKCKICGAEGKRFGVGPHVRLDPKFNKPKFNPCPGYDL